MAHDKNDPNDKINQIHPNAHAPGDASPEAEKPLTQEAILTHIEALHRESNIEGVLNYIESLPAEARTPDVIGEEARAWNNLGEPGDVEPFVRALTLLQSVPPQARENHHWYFRVGYALYWLDRPIAARGFFQKALDLLPGDEDTEDFIDMAKLAAGTQPFMHTFADRCDAFWKAFEAEEGEFARLAKEVGLHAVGQRIYPMLDGIQSERWSVGFGPSTPDDPRCRLIFSPQGSRVAAFTIREFIRRAPKTLLDRWSFEFGMRPLTPEAFAALDLTFEGIYLRPHELFVQPFRTDEGWELHVTGSEFEHLTDESAFFVRQLIEDFFRMSVGEAAQMCWFYRIVLRRWTRDARENRNQVAVNGEPPYCERMRLTDFADWAQSVVPEIVGYTMEDELAHVAESHEDPNMQPDCDVLMDAMTHKSACPVLLNAYWANRPQFMADLESQGATAGVFTFTMKEAPPMMKRGR